MKEIFSWEALLSREFDGADAVQDYIKDMVPDDLADTSNLEKLREINGRLERTERLYQIAAENFQELAAEMRAGVAILLDTEIIFANTELAKILGFANEYALIGQQIEQFTLDASRETVMETLARTHITSRSTEKVVLVCQDGTTVNAECTLRALSYSDEARMTVIRVERNGEA